MLSSSKSVVREINHEDSRNISRFNTDRPTQTWKSAMSNALTTRKKEHFSTPQPNCPMVGVAEAINAWRQTDSFRGLPSLHVSPVGSQSRGFACGLAENWLEKARPSPPRWVRSTQAAVARKQGGALVGGVVQRGKALMMTVSRYTYMWREERGDGRRTRSESI